MSKYYARTETLLNYDLALQNVVEDEHSWYVGFIKEDVFHMEYKFVSFTSAISRFTELMITRN